MSDITEILNLNDLLERASDSLSDDMLRLSDQLYNDAADHYLRLLDIMCAALLVTESDDLLSRAFDPIIRQHLKKIFADERLSEFDVPDDNYPNIRDFSSNIPKDAE